MNHRCIKAIVRGAVQGVGFRPFVYRLASELGLHGWVMNSPEGVLIEAEGKSSPLEKFLARLESDKPPLAIIQSLESHWMAPAGHKRFEIRASEGQAAKRTLILPDIATCADCLGEIFDPNNRRYLYPFTNCTNCGPRFSIIESLPYDRANTSMKQFGMCPECEREYHAPANRRFHAQPNACPVCGPQLALWDKAGKVTYQRVEALYQSIKAIREGKILALKGIGGFQLLADAQNEDAVLRLRQRKHREEKPFAMMFPSLAAVEADCVVGKREKELLQLPAAPIVLVMRRGAGFASVAPGNPDFGVMLPYSPLHHILLRNLGFPLVATSGNLTDEPICIDENEALERLHGIADVFLVHNRPVVRPVDDSVVRVVMNREMVIRRARGFAPLPVETRAAKSAASNVLALGAHLKNSVTLSVGDQLFISQHIGDLETPQAFAAFRAISRDLPGLYDAEPEVIACDMHPEYLSTKQAQAGGKPVVEIQHHFAHVAACMGENHLDGPVLGVAWDGTGYGTDGTIWGSEFLTVNTTPDDGKGSALFRRFAHFRNFRLPGGATAIRQPRRVALGLLWEIFGEKLFERTDLLPVQSFSPDELPVLRRMLTNQINSHVTCSAGRLFDAVASIIGLRQRTAYEGQAAMDLEFACRGIETDEDYGFATLPRPESLVIDWEPMVRAVIRDVQKRQSPGLIAAKFHNTLCRIIVTVAQSAGIPKVALTGGCFQNKALTEMTVQALQKKGFQPFWHQYVPPNDGGISFGQAVAAIWSISEKSPARTTSSDLAGSGLKTNLKPMERELYASTNDR